MSTALKKNPGSAPDACADDACARDNIKAICSRWGTLVNTRDFFLKLESMRLRKKITVAKSRDSKFNDFLADIIVGLRAILGNVNRFTAKTIPRVPNFFTSPSRLEDVWNMKEMNVFPILDPLIIEPEFRSEYEKSELQSANADLEFYFHTRKDVDWFLKQTRLDLHLNLNVAFYNVDYVDSDMDEWKETYILPSLVIFLLQC